MLLSEKERLIEELKQDKFLNKRTITILLILAFILICTTFYIARRNMINKKRFNALIKRI